MIERMNTTIDITICSIIFFSKIGQNIYKDIHLYLPSCKEYITVLQL